MDGSRREVRSGGMQTERCGTVERRIVTSYIECITVNTGRSREETADR